MTTNTTTATSRPLRWGIMGSSRIAQDFVHAIRDTLSSPPPSSSIVTVIGARQLSDAQRVAHEFAIPHAVGSFLEVAQHPEVDVVYVATVHSAHAELALLALENGKHVLVEKAFTINASEAQKVIDTARARKLFVMEALWSRFMPWAVKLRELLRDDAAIGPVRHVAADFGVEFPRTVRRLFEPDLAGGSLLDVGVYPLSAISMVYGDQVPRSIHALGDRFDTGVDSHVSITLSYGVGRHAQALSSAIVHTPRQAIITGTRGHIVVHDAETGYFHCSKTLTLYRHDGTAPQVFRFDALPTSGSYNFKHSEMLTYEIQEVHRCIAAGLLESPIMPHSATLTIMRTMDEIRRQVGVVYPSEK